MFIGHGDLFTEKRTLFVEAFCCCHKPAHPAAILDQLGRPRRFYQTKFLPSPQNASPIAGSFAAVGAQLLGVLLLTRKVVDVVLVLRTFGDLNL